MITATNFDLWLLLLSILAFANLIVVLFGGRGSTESVSADVAQPIPPTAPTAPTVPSAPIERDDLLAYLIRLFDSSLSAAVQAESRNISAKERSKCLMESNQFRADLEMAIVSTLAQPARPTLTVWFGSMPESNGKKNWTALLHRKTDNEFHGFREGITLQCSEYHDRVRYSADCARFLIGEISKQPDILDYDADMKSSAPDMAQPPQPKD